ncbi:hypothetical protein PQX77_014011 [Marasmius sp. AFHP31]|nr:hypothetical protein PQX77_014011 [Marasmius sp. AFHP31]
MTTSELRRRFVAGGVDVCGDDIVNSVTSQQMLLIPSAQLSLVVANFIADSILIWRCYTVWGYNKQVVAFPAVICFMNNILGVVTNALYIKHRRPEQLFQIPPTDPTSTLLTTFIFAMFFSNVFVAVLIAGRTSYLGRTSKALLEPDHQRMYKTAIAITAVARFIPALSGRVDSPLSWNLMVPDEVEVLEASSDEGAFVVDIKMMQFQKRVRVSNEVVLQEVECSDLRSASQTKSGDTTNPGSERGTSR